MKPYRTITRAFLEQVQRSPAAPAAVDSRRTVTYRQLERLAQQTSFRLSLRQDSPHWVGLVMDHSVEMVAAILGILESGHGYIPLEPDFPPQRIAYILRESCVDTVVTSRKYQKLFPHEMDLIFADEGMRADFQEQPVQAVIEHRSCLPAYILYTSGTTGAPKGVVVTQENVLHYVQAFTEEFHPGPRDVMLQYSVCTFDIFVEEVFPILLSGGTLAIADLQARQDFGKLVSFIEKHQVSIVSGFPYLMIAFNRLDQLPKSLRLLISGGDVLREEYVSTLLSRIEVYNTYGPSETTVCASYYRCTGHRPLPNGTFPIGREISGTRIILLDENLKPVPDGETGEICIFGHGVSLGYLSREEETAQAFLTDPATGQRFYRSGDLGQRLGDGNLVFLKRKDQQVMILGKRVEPLEVENLLCRCTHVEQAAVTENYDEKGLAYLTAYLVTDGKLILSQLRQELSAYLPTYMIPEYFLVMGALPQTLSGKYDRSALPVILKEGDCI